VPRINPQFWLGSFLITRHPKRDLRQTEYRQGQNNQSSRERREGGLEESGPSRCQTTRRYLASLALLLLRRRVPRCRPARGGASLLRGPVPATGTQGDHDRNPPPHPNKGRKRRRRKGRNSGDVLFSIHGVPREERRQPSPRSPGRRSTTSRLPALLLERVREKLNSSFI
jgi:hypothetical protein